VISVIFLKSKSRGIEGAMPSGVSKLAPIPMAGGYDLAPSGKMGFILRSIIHIHLLTPGADWYLGVRERCTAGDTSRQRGVTPTPQKKEGHTEQTTEMPETGIKFLQC